MFGVLDVEFRHVKVLFHIVSLKHNTLCASFECQQKLNFHNQRMYLILGAGHHQVGGGPYPTSCLININTVYHSDTMHALKY